LLSRGCLQWTGRKSNRQPLESDTLPLDHCTHGYCFGVKNIYCLLRYWLVTDRRTAPPMRKLRSSITERNDSSCMVYSKLNANLLYRHKAAGLLAYTLVSHAERWHAGKSAVWSFSYSAIGTGFIIVLRCLIFI